MSEWKEIILGDVIITNKQSINREYPFSEIQYLDTGSITCNKIESFQKFGIDEAPSRAKRLVSEDDIIYSTVRPNQLHYGYITNPPENLVVSTGFVVITCKKEFINPKFLYYYLTLNSTTEYLHSIAEASTSAYPSLKPSDIEAQVILLPPLSIQESIATLLNSIDNKIELLQRQNISLEELASVVYRQKFVEEATDGWRNEKLGDLADVQNGYAFSSRDYVEFQIGHLEVLKMGHIEKGGGLRTNPKKDFVPRNDKLKRWILNKGDIIMAMTDMKDNVVILGVPAMIDKDDKYVLNQRVARISLKSNDKLINNYLLYIQLKDSEFVANLQSKANSGVQVNLSTEAIKDSYIVIPPIALQNEIGKTITDLYIKKEFNDSQIALLNSLRNTLLPKFMSGEVTIEI